MLFDDINKGIAQAYLSMLSEAPFKVGDTVKDKRTGLLGTIKSIKDDYYIVKYFSGSSRRHGPGTGDFMKADLNAISSKIKAQASKQGDIQSRNAFNAVANAVKSGQIELAMKALNHPDNFNGDDAEYISKMIGIEESYNGTLEESSPMIKAPKNEFGKKADAFAHAKKVGGKVKMKTFTNPRTGEKLKSYVVVKEEFEIQEAKKLDSVDPKELKGDHKDREDKDIDNDGDVDSSDEYLHNRRKAISKSMKDEEVEIELPKKSKTKMKDDDEDDGDYDYDDDDDDDDDPKAKKKMKNEEVKRIYELSKKTLGRYVGKASDDMKKTDKQLGKSVQHGTGDRDKLMGRIEKRYQGVEKAKSKMREDVENIDELSKKTLGSYAKKAMQDYSDKLFKHASGSNSSKESSKKINTRGRYIDKAIDRMAKEDLEWDWESILEAPEEEIDALIEELSDEEFDSFYSELESLEEGVNMYQSSTSDTQPTDITGRETLEPRAQADREFADMHRDSTNVKDYPGKMRQDGSTRMSQAPVRPGEKRNSEPKKTLSDIRRRM